MRHRRWAATAAAALALLPATRLEAQCVNTITADVVAIDVFIWYNRLGARDPDGMMFALAQDVTAPGGGTATAGNAVLRAGKRPRPLTLRVNQGDCLVINFKNLLSPTAGNASNDRTGTRAASIHVTGMQLVDVIQSDGSNVGNNASGLVEPGNQLTYTLFAEKEGTYLLYSTAQTTGGEGDGGQIAKGLFGAVNVEPKNSQWYRSQLTNADLELAKTANLANGYPQLNYEAVYPVGHALAGRPILRMTQNGKIVHSDLNAIITGSGRGNFATGTYPDDVVRVYPERLRPFREFTVIFHDEVGLKQAFDDLFESQQFEHVLHGGRDAFSINYGTGGIGAEILANRFGLGPMWDCNDCKFEEFFLSSWAVGDPAMVVDSPSAAVFNPNAPPAPGRRATKALFPDDPSNVYHSYLNDHVKIRNLHAGPKEHHIFHLHAHQWLHTPNADRSNYNDSQAIGPGGGFTYEITYGGGGNRNKTPGDAIFHCHFYPHFAQGMWGLWRVHDVFERGTVLDGGGRPAAGSRALPDGEILAGTPIPAIVPIPTYAMAPLPSATMPGYPFYIPGVAGHRPPKPPLDTRFDGGLARHVVTDGISTFPALNTTDFSKHDSTLVVTFLPEGGTTLEQNAMAFHSVLSRTTTVADTWGSGSFFTNGLPPDSGAPYAEPCGENGVAKGTRRTYRAAAFQINARYNKAEWSFPQHRMFGLWDDVAAYRAGTRAPEPLFFRAKDGDCIRYHLVNLVPKEYEMDAFQVRTPTDVIGQHIHLVKFDVTSSDGAANGFNYEDGSLSPGDVQDRVKAIRRANGCAAATVSATCPKALPHPFFGVGPDSSWVGAQETIQKWWLDPVLRDGGNTRHGTVFTHDHFGPSTHQQTGLYAGLLPEDTGTVWRDPETGTNFGTRASDGGPTSWRADILYSGARADSSFREFAIQVADFALAYGEEGYAGTAASTGTATTGIKDPINPPGKFEPSPVLPNLLRPPAARNACPNGQTPPCPEIISADDPGTMLINYRNEPLALRVRDRATNAQAANQQGNLSRAFSSTMTRDDARLNTYGPYGARPGVRPKDPFTPLMRVYEDDRILVRLLVGAHEEGHNVSVHGTRWLFEKWDVNSGWRNSQMAGISEFYDFQLDPLMTNKLDTIADFVYQSSAVDDLWNGTWGLIRAYRNPQGNLLALHPSRPVSLSKTAEVADETAGRQAFLDGYAADIPDPNDTTQWTRDTTSVASSKTVTTETGTSKTYAAGTDAATSSDSVYTGYGNESTGGIEYDIYEYDPATGTEYVVTGDPDAPTKGFATASPGDAEAAKTEEAAVESGTKTPGSTTYVNSFGKNRGFRGVCPRVAPVRYFELAAVAAKDVLPNGRLVYNARTAPGGPLHDPSAIMYVFDRDLNANGMLRSTAPTEPLVLRANAGDCIVVLLHNRLKTPLSDPDGYNTLPMITDLFNANQVVPSNRVGLHPQLVAYDAQRSDGTEAGLNLDTTVPPGKARYYVWFAGDVSRVNGRFRATPIEFGATNLQSPDRIQHSNKGAVAALIIEPRNTVHKREPGTHSMARIYNRSTGTLQFREFVAVYQDDINLRFGSAATLPDTVGHSISFASGSAIPNTAEAEDPEDSGQKAFNYRTEPLWFRMGFAPNAKLGYTRTLDFRTVLRDVKVGGRPQTPIFTANAGDSVRFRVLEPGGHARNHVFNLHGHVWEELPYGNFSRQIVSNPFSEWKGTRDGHGPTNHADLVLKHGAGGKFHVVGEYLYRDQPSFQFDGGLWGIFKVNAGTVNFSSSSSNTSLQEADKFPRGCSVDPQSGKTVCNP